MYFRIRTTQLLQINLPMGVCNSSDNNINLTPQELKLRRSELIQYRSKWKKKSLKVTGNNPKVIFAVEVEPWIEPPEGIRGVADALASFQRGSHTSTREINYALSGLPSVDRKYDYAKSTVLSLKDRKTNDVICAALMVEHDEVMELIWFVTRRKEEGKGYGSTFFNCIRALLKQSQLKALVVTSTPQATGFWLLFMSKISVNLRYETAMIRSTKLDKKVANVTDLSARQRKHFKEHTRDFSVSRKPSTELRRFYKDLTSKRFLGKPYRMSVETTSHIWFRIGTVVVGELKSTSRKGTMLKMSTSNRITQM